MWIWDRRRLALYLDRTFCGTQAERRYRRAHREPERPQTYLSSTRLRSICHLGRNRNWSQDESVRGCWLSSCLQHDLMRIPRRSIALETCHFPLKRRLWIWDELLAMMIYLEDWLLGLPSNLERAVKKMISTTYIETRELVLHNDVLLESNHKVAFNSFCSMMKR